jgi:hypothetical protein
MYNPTDTGKYQKNNTAPVINNIPQKILSIFRLGSCSRLIQIERTISEYVLDEYIVLNQSGMDELKIQFKTTTSENLIKSITKKIAKLIFLFVI